MRIAMGKIIRPKKLGFILFLLIIGVGSTNIAPWLGVEAAPSAQSGPTPAPLIFEDIEFPYGEISFADRVTSYKSGEQVEAPFDDPTNSLGPPNYDSQADTGYVALGNSETTCGRELVVEFVDNILVDVPGEDLWIFEIGPSVETTEVYISPDGENWISLGQIEGSTRGIDIASYITPDQQFKFVKLCDYPDGETSPSPYGGPDIDAVGAIGTIPVETATPTSSTPPMSIQVAGISVVWWVLLCFLCVMLLSIGGVILITLKNRK